MRRAGSHSTVELIPLSSSLSQGVQKGWADSDRIWTRDLSIQGSALYWLSYPVDRHDY